MHSPDSNPKQSTSPQAEPEGLIQKGVGHIGNLCAWTMPALTLLVVTQVLLRYAMEYIPALDRLVRHQIKLEELQWHLYAIGLMIGLSYALLADTHIRVDIIYQHLPKRFRTAINISGTLLLLLPFCSFLFWKSLPFVESAWRIGERSDAPSGLPGRWIIKGFIPLGCLLLCVTALSLLAQSLRLARHARSKQNNKQTHAQQEPAVDHNETRKN